VRGELHFGEEHEVSLVAEVGPEGGFVRPAVLLLVDLDALGDVLCVGRGVLSLRWSVWKRIFCRNFGSSSFGVMR
jgi:hypothetical protein